MVQNTGSFGAAKTKGIILNGNAIVRAVRDISNFMFYILKFAFVGYCTYIAAESFQINFEVSSHVLSLVQKRQGIITLV